MKVYILFEFDGESSYVVSVFSNLASANQAKLLKEAEDQCLYEFRVEEEEVID